MRYLSLHEYFEILDIDIRTPGHTREELGIINQEHLTDFHAAKHTNNAYESTTRFIQDMPAEHIYTHMSTTPPGEYLEIPDTDNRTPGHTTVEFSITDQENSTGFLKRAKWKAIVAALTLLLVAAAAVVTLMTILHFEAGKMYMLPQ